MITFVILAAGRGTRVGRVGDQLHKALIPLDNKAVLTRLIELAPKHSKIVIMTGHRENQLEEYIELAHPSSGIELVTVDGWDGLSGGPGLSLLRSQPFVEGDLVFTSCDTLWEKDLTLWDTEDSWSAVAPIPAGTSPARWCCMQVDKRNTVINIYDKVHVVAGNLYAYTGLSYIKEHDLETFWEGVTTGSHVQGEMQVTGGLQRIYLEGRKIRWTDVGDEKAYRAAVARLTGYDFVKEGEATYVLPEQGRVVKWWADADTRAKRYRRAQLLEPAVPPIVDTGLDNMLAYQYTPGVSGYQALDAEPVHYGHMFGDLLAWAEEDLWREDETVPQELQVDVCTKFYRDKTLSRVKMLRDDLRVQALDAVGRIDWDQLVAGCIPGRIHGDFNLGNMIFSNTRDWIGIDWREDFGGEVYWGDIRYDMAKLWAGLRVHWDRAQRGDFRPWDKGPQLEDILSAYTMDVEYVPVIAALSMLNSAPLHAAPLDEVLVARGCAWLEEEIG